MSCHAQFSLLFLYWISSQSCKGKYEVFARILVIGGDTADLSDTSSAELLEIPTASKFGVLNAGAETVATPVRDFNVSLSGAVSAAFKYTERAMVIVCGGKQNGTVSADCWIKEEGKNSYWKKGPSMPEPRTKAAFWSDDDKLIVMGGLGGPNGFTELSSTVIFWAANKSWTVDPKLTLPINDEGFSLSFDFINYFKTGGVNGGESAFTLKPDAAQNESPLKDLPNMKQSRTGHVSFLEEVSGITDISIIVAGGDRIAIPTRTTEAFDRKNNKWIAGPDLPRDFAHGCVIADTGFGGVYLIGGHQKDGRVIVYDNNKFHLTNIRLETPREKLTCILLPGDVTVDKMSSSGTTIKGSIGMAVIMIALRYL